MEYEDIFNPLDFSFISESGIEVPEPFPNIFDLFAHYNDLYFAGELGACSVEWSSSRMTLCAGVCHFRTKGGCTIRLSEPILKFRPARDLKETLLHEMIHAFFFLRGERDDDRSGHGSRFQAKMREINQSSKPDHQRPTGGYRITVFHAMHAEVEQYRRHVWRCHRCTREVRRAMNRPPQEADCRGRTARGAQCRDVACHWHVHLRTCGGAFEKIAEPPPTQASKQQQAKRKSKITRDTPRVTLTTGSSAASAVLTSSATPLKKTSGGLGGGGGDGGEADRRAPKRARVDQREAAAAFAEGASHRAGGPTGSAVLVLRSEGREDSKKISSSERGGAKGGSRPGAGASKNGGGMSTGGQTRVLDYFPGRLENNQPFLPGDNEREKVVTEASACLKNGEDGTGPCRSRPVDHNNNKETPQNEASFSGLPSLTRRSPTSSVRDVVPARSEQSKKHVKTPEEQATTLSVTASFLTPRRGEAKGGQGTEAAGAWREEGLSATAAGLDGGEIRRQCLDAALRRLEQQLQDSSISNPSAGDRRGPASGRDSGNTTISTRALCSLSATASTSRSSRTTEEDDLNNLNINSIRPRGHDSHYRDSHSRPEAGAQGTIGHAAPSPLSSSPSSALSTRGGGGLRVEGDKGAALRRAPDGGDKGVAIAMPKGKRVEAVELVSLLSSEDEG